jgi:hypothetical protein
MSQGTFQEKKNLIVLYAVVYINSTEKSALLVLITAIKNNELSKQKQCQSKTRRARSPITMYYKKILFIDR